MNTSPMEPIASTDLILNEDGSVFHLHLRPGEVAETLILVGDPGRVRQVSARFDSIELEKQNREFMTHTGTLNGKRLSVISTGIGTDNIDIVLNELDALFNIDLKARLPLSTHTPLRIIRLGTSGGLQPGLEPGTIVLSRIAGGLDGLLHYYKHAADCELKALSEAFVARTGWPADLARPYFIEGSAPMAGLLGEKDIVEGITLSTPGFYAPQFRSLRMMPFDPTMIGRISGFSYNGLRVLNFEMESSAIYALSRLMGHQALTLCVAIGNRIDTDFMVDYKPAVERMIDHALKKLTLHEAG